MPHISDAEFTSHGELRDHFDLMCLEGYVIPLQRTRPPPGLRLPKSGSHLGGDKNPVSNIEQVLEAAPRKAVAIRPPTIHHENYQN